MTQKTLLLTVLFLLFPPSWAPAWAVTTGVIASDESSATITIQDDPHAWPADTDGTTLYDAMAVPATSAGSDTLQKAYSTGNQQFGITCLTRTGRNWSSCAIVIKPGDDSAISYGRQVASYSTDGDIAAGLFAAFTAPAGTGGVTFTSVDEKAFLDCYSAKFLFTFAAITPSPVSPSNGTAP